jgi:hypothetical protein
MRPQFFKRASINHIPSHATPGGIFKIYGGGGLGDIWTSICYLIKLSDQTKQPTTISAIDKYGGNQTNTLNEIINLFNANNKIHITQKLPTRPLTFDIWRQPTLKIPNKQWQRKKYHRICYQLDGISNAIKKNPPPGDIPRLTNFINGYEFIKLGRPLTIIQNIEELLHCDLFFGVCSGISFIAHSVGCPVFLIQYSHQLDSWHQNKSYFKCNGTDDLIAKAQAYLK